MQTFIPFSSLTKIAQCLDYRRLGKQRVETKQIYLALSGSTNAWKNHPAVKMWTNHLNALALYGHVICLEWKQRGYKDSLDEWFLEQYFKPSSTSKFMPWWWGNKEIHLSHQSNLIRKDPDYYLPIFGDSIPNNLPYIWPVNYCKVQ